MLVDDHTVVRSGLAAFLYAYDDFELVGEASDGEEALRLCARVQPDVILMDLIMPRMDGATATRAIRERYPNIQILVLTSFKEDNLVHDALKAGAIGYLLKNVTADELANAIRAAHRGRTTLAPEAAEVLIHAATQQNTPEVGHDLTAREREVLDLMVKGLDNNKIAEALVVSRSTVKFHVSNILSKLYATSRTEAVVIALQHNLVAQKP
ncbi:MAG: response regulator transcription factor [Caldilineaceae bacterium]|nr:response regulator transcription factor [Caldilineaceae bacterium]